MGKIKLEEIEVMVRIGLLEEELYAPQDLLVSLELEYDFSLIALTDEIGDGMDYRELVDRVRKFSKSYDGKSLERYAHLMASDIKSHFSAKSISLTVDKPRYVKKLGLRKIQVNVEI